MKLTDAQTAVLTAAAARADGAILPLPSHLRGGAVGMVCDALVAKELAFYVGLARRADPRDQRRWSSSAWH